MIAGGAHAFTCDCFSQVVVSGSYLPVWKHAQVKHDDFPLGETGAVVTFEFLLSGPVLQTNHHPKIACASSGDPSLCAGGFIVKLGSI